MEAALINVLMFWMLTTPHEFAHAWVAMRLGDDTPVVEGRVDRSAEQYRVTMLLVLWALVMIVPPILRWALFDAVWTSAAGEECRRAAGACWAVVAEKYRLILFGTFPYEEHWRGLMVIAIVVYTAVNLIRAGVAGRDEAAPAVKPS